MQLNTVIFDMDGLLIDSEPCWQEAGKQLLEKYNISLTPEQYHRTTGLRSKEWITFWFNFFDLDPVHALHAEGELVQNAIEKIARDGKVMPGVDHILSFFRERNFNIGLATSSPMALVDVVLKKMNKEHFFDTLTSAEYLPYGKPHPQVYMNCAEALKADPQACLCFEDSFNGLIAAKAAKMKCIVVPDPAHAGEAKWGAADGKLTSLLEFDEAYLQSL